jgi:hypothetical protein
MKDFKGNILHEGDMVICILGAASSPFLYQGKITKIYKNNKECSVDGSSHIFSNRIMLCGIE